ncbi:carbohydrate ABC transporter permease [Enterococcus casseliflavus]|uniref:carbohydrate ABC transporter permease n=1 Tax=Enterococcus TaxID=1350 RepID=UPI0001B6DB92|nr:MULTISPECIES: carbohydrate ABC transporter permease [Enterococcus]AYJ44726.1 carbohydrate ABC transporter permease [Enterococcus casseliflavus]EEV30094.1 sugar ABC transporter permease [Enterococcus casseliflavus EC30]EEV36429.1 sugar ABC transporter permease [Enterococcus casseliflavus EC10]MBS5813939.1 carbohydrate ABC transporter permease [Enterococcus casseliflavus]MDB1686734.1 carbohydrate ABC transporter permease [Enterococcus casseliflavus]
MKTTSLIKDTRADKIFLIFVYVFLAISLLIVLYPLIYIISASISNPHLVNSGEMWLLPKGITFEGYRTLLGNSSIWRGYLNTIYYTVLGTSINLLVTLPCAYALSREDFYGRRAFTNFMLVTMFLSGGLIPSYLLIRSLGMLNTVWALVIPGAVSVYNVVVTRTFFQSTIPREMEEAAIVDGCSDFRLFMQIVLPLSTPIIAVMALFYGVGHWNSFFNALIYLSDRSMYPLQMILREILILQDMSSNTVNNVTSEMANMLYSKQQLAQVIKYGVMIVSSLPVIIVYPFLQKYFVKGMMVGSIKG